MLEFDVTLRPGLPVHQQVFYAVKRAIVSGTMTVGDRFPSVRDLSKELQINPNTAHKVVASLVQEGFLEVLPGIGTVVSNVPASSRAQRQRLLDEPLERIVVESKRLDLTLDELVNALQQHWFKLTHAPDRAKKLRRGRRAAQ